MSLRRSEKGEGLDVESLGGESREAFRTDGLFKRLQRYGSAKENTYQFVPYLRQAGEEKLADDLANCANYATFREYFTVGETRLSRICTCKKHLLCPLCAIRRGAKALRVYLARVEYLLKADPLLKAYLVTVTVKNGHGLAERFSHLVKSLRYMHKLRHLKRGHEVDKARSAVWSYEFTNEGKGWHPHVHAVWLCREEPDMHRLRDEWKAITGDSFMCHVRPIDEADPVAGFCEVFKYALKFSGLADDHRLHAYRTLKGKRLQDSFGDLRGLDVEPSDSDELLDDLPYIERLYHFIPGIGYKLSSEAQVNPKSEEDRMLEALIGMGWPDDQIVAFMKSREVRHAA
jgi:hypothetical protein